MLIIGVTGGIGCGKTTVTERFAKRGITIVDADIISRIVVEPGTTALNAITNHFGEGLISVDGRLDRAALRQTVFEDKQERNWLESLLHPLINEEILRQLKASTSAYTILVSPLLVETTQRNICDRILVIDVPESIQLERASSRDNNNPEQIKKIMAAQINRQHRLSKADDIIDNTASLEYLEIEIEKFHQGYLSMAKNYVCL
tara:strand:- start:954 stop:1562 length:609 start_codon:yes stop_codon:yes gene_type:complete